jgi:hypothetical protein
MAEFTTWQQFSLDRWQDITERQEQIQWNVIRYCADVRDFRKADFRRVEQLIVRQGNDIKTSLSTIQENTTNLVKFVEMVEDTLGKAEGGNTKDNDKVMDNFSCE